MKDIFYHVVNFGRNGKGERGSGPKIIDHSGFQDGRNQTPK